MHFLDNDKAKPAVRRGRKSTGLIKIAGLPKGDPAFLSQDQYRKPEEIDTSIIFSGINEPRMLEIKEDH